MKISVNHITYWFKDGTWTVWSAVHKEWGDINVPSSKENLKKRFAAGVESVRIVFDSSPFFVNGRILYRGYFPTTKYGLPNELPK